MRLKKEKGVTLIALIVTVLVLLILAGITVSALINNDNAIIDRVSDSTVYAKLADVQEAIELYVVHTRSKDDTADVLLKNNVIKKYKIEETYRPIGVVERFDLLGIEDNYGEGYKDVTVNSLGYISKLQDLKNVYAIDLVDGSLYFVNNGKIWNVDGNREIAENYGIVEADTNEWTFNSTTQTLTAYRWGSRLNEQRGKQAPGELIIPNYYNGVKVKGIGANIFQNKTDITKLTISEGIETIGGLSFCRML